MRSSGGRSRRGEELVGAVVGDGERFGAVDATHSDSSLAVTL